MSEAPLDVCAATKRFGDTVAVNGIDLTLDEHEVAAVVGPSGCGKSTLLRMIGGLEHLDSGAIRLAGRLVDDGRTQRPPERRSVGLVFQEHALFPHLTVAANVAFGLRDHAKSAVIERVAEMLGVVSLDGYDARYPHELSGGERQRVALARALAPSPALMLFDEPFASLDRNLRDDLRRQVLAALRATGTAALIVTHDQHEALSMGDRIAVMRAGSLVQLDTPSAVFHTPADRFTAAFMGEASFLPVERTDGRPATCLGPLDDPSSTAPITMVRPDDVAYRTLETSTPTTRGAVSADVVATEYRGTEWLVTARLADGTTVQAATSHLTNPTIGDVGEVVLVEGHRQVPIA